MFRKGSGDIHHRANKAGGDLLSLSFSPRQKLYVVLCVCVLDGAIPQPTVSSSSSYLFFFFFFFVFLHLPRFWLPWQPASRCLVCCFLLLLLLLFRLLLVTQHQSKASLLAALPCLGQQRRCHNWLNRWCGQHFKRGDCHSPWTRSM